MSLTYGTSTCLTVKKNNGGTRYKYKTSSQEIHNGIESLSDSILIFLQ